MHPTTGSSVLYYHVSYISDGKSMIRDTTTSLRLRDAAILIRTRIRTICCYPLPPDGGKRHIAIQFEFGFIFSLIIRTSMSYNDQD